MNRRELLLSAAAATVVAAAPGARAQVQPQITYPGVYVQELPGPQAIIGLPTSAALFVGPFSTSLPTGSIGTSHGSADTPAGFDLASAEIRQFFDQGGATLRLVQAATGADGRPDYAGAIAGLESDGAPDFNLLLLVGAASQLASAPASLASLYRDAAALARGHFAHLLIEAPDAAPDYAAWRTSLGLNNPDMAAWAPWLTAADGSLIPPGAAIAGLIARTDAATGVWQAPAGQSASLNGFTSRDMAADQLQAMNTAHVNPIRPLQGAATAWGARNLSDDPDWLYLPVRRLVRWTEASLMQGLAWTVFEPNTPALWQAVVRDVTQFLDDLWRQGALVGTSAGEAFSVRCGLGETMTPIDVAGGLLRVQIGISPVRPAEFIIITLEMDLGAG